MTFIPEGYVLLSEWLDGQARELFPEDYPPDVADDDVEAYIAEHPLEPDSVEAPSPGAHAISADDPVAQLPAADTDTPILQFARVESERELNRQLRELSDPTHRLARYRHFVREHLERDRAGAVAKLKWRAFEHHRQQFYSGALGTIWIAADGSNQRIPGHRWGGDDAERLITSGLFCDRPILIPTHDRARVNTSAAAKKCRQWLIDLMTRSPEKKTASKVQLMEECVQKFKISKRTFSQEWRNALNAVGPNIAKVWKRAGQLAKQSQR
jgi:hypothetical protein